METLQEKAQKIKIVFFDIDDTLRAKKTAFMPESVNRAFEKLRARGILTGIATGRNLYGVVPEVRALNPDYFVTINGAYVENGALEVIYKHPFATALVEEIISWLEAEKAEYAFVGSHELRVSHWNDIVADAIIPIYKVLDEDGRFYQTHDVFQMLTLSADNDALKVPPTLTDQIRLVRWHDYSSDIVPLAGSKADGVQRVLDTLGLTADNVMNFGDELNDLELFDMAGLSVAMKVSHPLILDKADLVADNIENDGIYKALIQLGLID